MTVCLVRAAPRYRSERECVCFLYSAALAPEICDLEVRVSAIVFRFAEVLRG